MPSHNSDGSAQRDPRRDKRLSLKPLDFEEAVSDLLEAGPHPKEADKEKAPAGKPRRGRKGSPRPSS